MHALEAAAPDCAPAAGDSKEATPPHVYEVLKPVLLEKEKAEDRLKVCWAVWHIPCRRCLPLQLAPRQAAGCATLHQVLPR